MNTTLDMPLLFQLGFYLLALIFIIHALVVGYHWLTFGADRKVSMIGIAIYLLGGAVLLGLMAISLTLMN